MLTTFAGKLGRASHTSQRNLHEARYGTFESRTGTLRFCDFRNLSAAKTEFILLPGPRITSTRGTGFEPENGWAMYGTSVVLSTRNRGGFCIGVGRSITIGSTNLHSRSS